MESHIFDKGLLSKIYKDCLQLQSAKTNKQQKHVASLLAFVTQALQIVLPGPLVGKCRYNYLYHFPCPIFIRKPIPFLALKSLSLCSVTLGYIWFQYTPSSSLNLVAAFSLSGMLTPCFPLTSTTSLAKY